eukprot:scaffold6050_cov70-Cyclotella_meneghiniana.AAC.9
MAPLLLFPSFPRRPPACIQAHDVVRHVGVDLRNYSVSTTTYNSVAVPTLPDYRRIVTLTHPPVLRCRRQQSSAAAVTSRCLGLHLKGPTRPRLRHWHLSPLQH